ncbi:unnamed protein product [Pleuronectes platessa]|uniref:Uncharacterized protein n=1 Tax=Pleuronectes platessa TaxID=8262 RepID=A0A9N7YFE4_PLEPL|nr:unnamed protein product [Pleuronectes platessa]
MFDLRSAIRPVWAPGLNPEPAAVNLANAAKLRRLRLVSCLLSWCLDRSLTLRRVGRLTLADLLGGVTQTSGSTPQVAASERVHPPPPMQRRLSARFSWTHSLRLWKMGDICAKEQELLGKLVGTKPAGLRYHDRKEAA